MNQAEQLHTLARRYCMVMAGFWGRKYTRLMNSGRDRMEDGGYTVEAEELFPRYLVLDAILAELERSDGTEFATEEEAHKKILAAVWNAQSRFTENKEGIFRQTAGAERQLMTDYLKKRAAEGISRVQPLPYRRTLSKVERTLLWEDLREKWGISDFWYPLTDAKPKDTEAFMEDYFEEEVGFEALRAILHTHGIERVFELREFDHSPEYQLDIEGFNPVYTINGEGYWFAADMDWVIYASHENSITIAGEWLLNEIKEIWPGWEERRWLDWQERLRRGV
ncbi:MULTISPECIES: hypothetical protein [unclassified Paenibacillus]|uniref:hypothetical protein n=1 Tax=unclassified Paenibacillus TaxID=185978 RepID=UPI002406301C|nr:MULTISPECIES: hypothetical protein [unclassified Paenibacillus]MDF9839846.1 hypothetical protein [Paenibacillus sp. PastF-2]MDF9846427.1 hypothetical protein [Paenibacillus sp. PastM-2]MDF9853224.1 hypothetical protein [Paenibacillus sp. PastF-1]MDH6478272.1 hypothetical protein [Paenibacillus sp. PastH-2]MDH6506229.1 hypothetical protein [Paenibacillus sp. PastM-3]